VQQASKNNNVHVINDELINTHLTPEFSNVYKHLSTNDYNFELMCFNRWFILLNYMKAKNINMCFHIDSDVLLFSDVEKDYINYEQYDFTLSHRTRL